MNKLKPIILFYIFDIIKLNHINILNFIKCNMYNI